MREVNMLHVYAWRRRNYISITFSLYDTLSPTDLGFESYLYYFKIYFLLRYDPKMWKIAKVIIILKPRKAPHEASSYRPISLLPIISKVYEKLHFKRIKINWLFLTGLASENLSSLSLSNNIFNKYFGNKISQLSGDMKSVAICQ